MPEAGSLHGDKLLTLLVAITATSPLLDELDHINFTKRKGRVDFLEIRSIPSRNLKGYISPTEIFKRAPGKCVSEYLFRDTTLLTITFIYARHRIQLSTHHHP